MERKLLPKSSLTVFFEISNFKFECEIAPETYALRILSVLAVEHNERFDLRPSAALFATQLIYPATLVVPKISGSGSQRTRSPVASDTSGTAHP